MPGEDDRLPLKPGDVLTGPPGSICDFLLTQSRPGPGEKKIEAVGGSSHRVTLLGMTGELLLTPEKWALVDFLALPSDVTDALLLAQAQYELEYWA